MITFDIHNRVKDSLKSYNTYVIPLIDGSEYKNKNKSNWY